MSQKLFGGMVISNGNNHIIYFLYVNGYILYWFFWRATFRDYWSICVYFSVAKWNKTLVYAFWRLMYVWAGFNILKIMLFHRCPLLLLREWLLSIFYDKIIEKKSSNICIMCSYIQYAVLFSIGLFLFAEISWGFLWSFLQSVLP